MKNRASASNTRLAATFALSAALGCGPTPPTVPEQPCATIVPGDLVISEFMADPAGSDTGKQYVEIYNTTDHTVDLHGLSLFQSMSDGSRLNASVLPAASVASHGYYVLGDAGSDAAARPAYLNYGYGSDLGALRHESGKVGLRCSTTTITEAVYESVTPGHARTFDGAKLPNATDLALTLNWCDASNSLDALAPPGENFGSPGAPNQPCPAHTPPANSVTTGGVHQAGTVGIAATATGGTSAASADGDTTPQCFDAARGTRRPVNRLTPGDLLITEIMPAPSINNNGAGEWFEILATRAVDLNGLELVNEGTGSTLLSSDACLTISSNTSWVFARSNDPAQNGGLPAVSRLFDFTLADAASASYPERAIALRLGAQEIDRAGWIKSIKGTSLQRSSASLLQGTKPEWCSTPSEWLFGAGDRGTPGAANVSCTVETVDAGTPTSDGGNGASGATQSTTAATARSEGGSGSTRVGSTLPVHLGGTASVRSGVGGVPELTGGTHSASTRSGSGGAPAFGGADNAGAPAQGGDSPSSTGSGTSTSLDASTTDAASIIDAIHDHECVDSNGDKRPLIAPQSGDLVITEVMSAPSNNNNGAAEWFEILANADVDLNGLEVANEGTGTLDIASDACLHAKAGERLVFARGTDFEQNGGLPFVTLTFAFTLADSATSTHPVRAVILRFAGTEISRAEWLKSTKGTSWQRQDPLPLDGGFVEADGGVDPDEWCLTPTGVSFGSGDRGTPGLSNLSCDAAT
jgi:hypothetical protein